ncbi:MAG TPA: hypothetical protein VFE31_05470 [Opitutaceae bacterium]|jgi:hypothetical protein|nr:hypothetical protein [Opitutaceae bacterium]
MHRLAFTLIALAAFAGCDRSQVQTYQVPKEKDPVLPGMSGSGPDGSMAANGGGAMTGSVPTDSGPALTWTAPADWQSAPAGPMRKASYTVSGPEGRAEISVTAFPGDVGGELANVNRWRGQAGLPPLTADTLDQNVDRINVNGLSCTLVDLGDARSANRILGAIIPFGGGVWFVKMNGPGALLEREKGEFRSFVGSLKPPPNA